MPAQYPRKVSLNSSSLNLKHFDYNDFHYNQRIKCIWQRTGEALALVQIQENVEAFWEKYQIHPLLIDLCAQILVTTLPTEQFLSIRDTVYLTTKLESFQIDDDFTQQILIHVVLKKENLATNSSIIGDVCIFRYSEEKFDGIGELQVQGEQIAEIKELQIQALSLMNSIQSAQESFQNKLYEIVWKKVSWEALSPFLPSSSSGAWLVFLDETGVGQNLISLLQEPGKAYFTVTVGDHYQTSKSGHFQINPRRKEDIHRLIYELNKLDQLALTDVIHLWSLDVKSAVQTTDISLLRDQERSVASALHLIQSIVEIKQDYSKNTRIWFVTQNAQAIETEKVAIGCISLLQLDQNSNKIPTVPRLPTLSKIPTLPTLPALPFFFTKMRCTQGD